MKFALEDLGLKQLAVSKIDEDGVRWPFGWHRVQCRYKTDNNGRCICPFPTVVVVEVQSDSKLEQVRNADNCLVVDGKLYCQYCESCWNEVEVVQNEATWVKVWDIRESGT